MFKIKQNKRSSLIQQILRCKVTPQCDIIWRWPIKSQIPHRGAPLQAMMRHCWPSSGPDKMDVSLKCPTCKIVNMAQINQMWAFFGKDAVLSGVCILDVGQFWFIWFVLG